MGRGEKEREGKPVRGEGGSASLNFPRAPPPLHGRVVPRTSTHIITITRALNQDKAKERFLKRKIFISDVYLYRGLPLKYAWIRNNPACVSHRKARLILRGFPFRNQKILSE